jgi:hypothetical protein
MQERIKMIAKRVGTTVSFILLFKSMVGFSIAALALVGVVVPTFGLETTLATEGAAATAGAVIGAVLALRG